jgi:hypothetical protein
MSAYENNRVKFPLEELRKYAGQWVAFSMDGRRILASAETIPDLEKQLTATGEDPQNVALERIEVEDGRLDRVEFL